MSSMYQNEKSQMFASVQRTLDQAPPPTLREILTAYRSKGDGDRDMLLTMLNAKTAEDQRIAETAALHRTVLERYAQEQSAPNLPPLVYPNASQAQLHNRLPTLSSGLAYPAGEPYSTKRRSSRSPHHHTYSPYSQARPLSRTSVSPPVQMPPSPYSSASQSDLSLSPKSREQANMPIASMLSDKSGRASSPLSHTRAQTEEESQRGHR